jgi:multidrug efflux system membrane fusion protein
VFAVPQDQAPQLQARITAGATLAAVALDRTRVDTLGTGSFAALDNVVDVQTGTVRAKARFANETLALFPSQFVNLRLELNTIKGAVMVPVTALRHGSSGDFVYVLNPAERTVALRQVVRGQSDAYQVEIRKGLKVGEQVITEGADRLTDGAKVILPGDKARGSGKRSGGAARPGAASGSASGSASGAASGTSGANSSAHSRSNSPHVAPTPAQAGAVNAGAAAGTAAPDQPARNRLDPATGSAQ